MSRELCGICGGSGEVETMDGRETCPSCWGRGFAGARVILRKSSNNATQLAIEAMKEAFKQTEVRK